MTAYEILHRAAGHLHDRAAQYDQPGGERSREQAVAALNVLTGNELRTSDGWLLLALVKLVRDQTTDTPHTDSIEDCAAYLGLYGEERMR